MKITRTAISEVVVVEPVIFSDDRGWFMESFNELAFHKGLADAGLPIPKPFVQSNHSSSKKNVLRGLHYQLPPHAQGKLVRVVKGAVFDVAVDIRHSSESFGNWVGVELSAINKKMLWIPEGFAHGFLALEEGTEFLYETTSYYSKECERAIRWDDAELNINWPVLDRASLIVSLKDREALRLKQVSTADLFSV